jgi:hypothetical protein
MKFKGLSKPEKIWPKSLKLLYTLLSFANFKIFTANIHIGTVEPNNINLAKKNILIPNLEWLRDSSFNLLHKMDSFICKTYSAKEFCDQRGYSAIYTSFSTVSPYLPAYKQKKGSFIHIAGASVVKGTTRLAEIWNKHPEWPKLTILARTTEKIQQYQSDNLEIVTGYLDKSDLKKYQNEAEVHVCPSEAEGFGHYICEPLSLGAIVMTVDGFPMNELVQPDRGILIKVKYSEPMYHAKRFIFDQHDFETKINDLLKMNVRQKQELKQNAMIWFNNNDAFFKNTFKKAINEIID